MNKVNLVIADYDDLYLDRLVEFINLSYPNRFKVVSFTKENLLIDYLTNTNDEINILLSHKDLIPEDALTFGKVELIITLSDGSFGFTEEKGRVINKFQSGERLVSQLLEVYSQKNSQAAKVVIGTASTKVVTVYSPVGGAGKTTITLGLAAKLSELGLKVFCLSLESLNSLGRVLATQGNDALTYILLSLKEARATFPVKVEALKTRNPNYKIDFFEPAECFLELSEIDSGVIGDLINELQTLGKYDVILIDTDPLADDRTMKLFSLSDKILYLKTLDPLGRIKSEEFLDQLQRIGLASELGIHHKLVKVTNKAKASELAEVNISLDNPNVIPYIENLWLAEKGQVYFDVNGELSHHLTNLARTIQAEAAGRKDDK